MIRKILSAPKAVFSSKRRVDRKQLPESGEQLSAAQLLSAIEFFRQFPELTLHLATVLQLDEQGEKTAEMNSGDELPEFPKLISIDPREVKVSVGDKCENEKVTEDDEFELFAAGCLPPPPEPAPAHIKRKKKFWSLLFPAALLLLSLLWLHDFV